MGNTLKINRSKVVQRKILLAWSHVGGRRGLKSQNVNDKFEGKINVGFILSKSELVKKHCSFNILAHFQLKKI